MLKAVIFDCDGVITDSEISRFRHLKKLAEERGHFGLDERKHMKFLIGKKSRDTLTHVFGGKISEQVIEQIVEKRRQDWEDCPEKFITEMRGVTAVCEKLGKKYTLAVASTASRKTVDATLRHLGLAEKFKIITTGDDVSNTKPNPEIYLKTLQKLGLKADECLAVEDSNSGINAAKTAGIKIVALKNELYNAYGCEADLSKADAVISGLDELIGITEGIK
ncbi:TPA: HAD family phosphatase [Candidatus Woesearchaeota archaeon]|nr:HAD family phosphatase [Candidatus Woesearchaeota archaeon]